MNKNPYSKNPKKNKLARRARNPLVNKIKRVPFTSRNKYHFAYQLPIPFYRMKQMIEAAKEAKANEPTEEVVATVVKDDEVVQTT